MDFDVRPWGFYQVVEANSDYKIKTLYIKAGQRLSLQKHNYREEHWLVADGYGTATVDGKDIMLVPGKYVKVPVFIEHRIKAISDMTIVEVQRGTSFSEDDIVRIEDDYGR